MQNEIPNIELQRFDQGFKEQILFLVGAISSLVDDISNNPGENDLNHLRLFLSLMTIPVEDLKTISTSSSVDFLSNLAQLINAESFNDAPIHPFYLGKIFAMVYSIRTQENIKWYDWSDSIFSETLTNDLYDSIDLDTVSLVKSNPNDLAIRWTFPSAESYWATSNTQKLIHCAILMMEELLHIIQLIKPGKVELLSIGAKFNIPTDDEDRVILGLIERLQETDVTNTLATLIPSMISQNWQWYVNRASQKKHEQYYPLSLDYMWLIGRLVAELTDDIGNFILDTMSKMPDYLSKDFRNIINYFSNDLVIRSTETYFNFITVFNNPKLDDKAKESISSLRKAEFSRISIFDYFFQYCIYCKSRYGDGWMVKSVNENPECISELTEVLFEYFQKNPNELGVFTSKYKPGLKTKLFKPRLKNFDDLITFLSKFINTADSVEA